MMLCLTAQMKKSNSYELDFLDAGVGFEPHDLRVMRSYIDVAPSIEVLDRTGVATEKPTI